MRVETKIQLKIIALPQAVSLGGERENRNKKKGARGKEEEFVRVGPSQVTVF